MEEILALLFSLTQNVSFFSSANVEVRAKRRYLEQLKQDN